MKKLAVIAFGGNALLRGDQKGTIDEQEQNVYQTCTYLLQLIEKGYNIVIGHGNGPQVGNVLLQHDAGARMYDIPAQPMDICVAETQGSIGYMIEQQMRNVLESKNIDKDIITLVTQVLVDKSDPAFSNPTKPVGPFYTREEADQLIARNGWFFNEDPRKRGWRRVVASPKPTRINNVRTIEKIARDGQIVVTVGGGGIPVFYVESNKLQGIDAVIDKDLASSLLAANIHADEFYILTDVPKAFINFHKPDQQALDTITVAEAHEYLAQGQFAEGSMAPKIRAAIQFVENGGKECIITEATQLGIEGAGTRIIRNSL